MTTLQEDSIYTEARRFAWNHFDLHAKHRLEMFKSYVAFLGLTYAGYAASLQLKAYIVAYALSLLAIAVSAIFFLFDIRIRTLLKISERYLLDSEKELSELLSNSNIRLFRKSDLITHINVRCFRITYSNLFWGLYFGNILVAIGSLLFVVIYSSV